MPQYRVAQKSFIHNRIVEEGELIDYDGEAADNLEPIKPAKKSKPAEEAPSETGGDLV